MTVIPLPTSFSVVSSAASLVHLSEQTIHSAGLLHHPHRRTNRTREMVPTRLPIPSFTDCSAAWSTTATTTTAVDGQNRFDKIQEDIHSCRGLAKASSAVFFFVNSDENSQDSVETWCSLAQHGIQCQITD